MSTPMKVVCPKCKAKLKISPEKIASEVARFKCPGCGTVLRIKPPAQSQNEPSQPSSQPAPEPGKELLDLGHIESETGFADDRAEEQVVPDNQEEILEGRGNSRKFKRVKFKKKVLVNNQIMVEALDISENGLFLHTGRSFDDGAIVEVAIPTVHGSFDLKVQAKVQHNQRAIGMGMMFVDLDNSQKARLQKLIDSLDAAAQTELEGRMKVLLVGGSDTARNINKSKLVLDGFYVMQATSVEAVYNVLHHEEPDAIVLDWQETAFNCRGLFYQIKEKHEFDNIIIVVLSALTDSDVQKEIIDAGADRYMAKMDTNPAKLSMVLKELIEERRG